MDLPVLLVFALELGVDAPRDRDHKSSKLDADFGGGVDEAFNGATPTLVGAADIDSRADVAGDSDVEVDHKLADGLLAGGEKVCLLVGESAPIEELPNAVGVAGLGTCAGKDEPIMGARPAAGGLVLRSISINVGLAGGGTAAAVDGGEDGAAWKSAKSSSARPISAFWNNLSIEGLTIKTDIAYGWKGFVGVGRKVGAGSNHRFLVYEATQEIDLRFFWLRGCSLSCSRRRTN